jgi:hypothetical protein
MAMQLDWGGRIMIFEPHHGALFNDGGTSTGTPQLLWAHTLDLRPMFYCGPESPEFVHVHVMHASMRGSVHVLSRQAMRLLDAGFSACLHNCTCIRRVCSAQPSTLYRTATPRFACRMLKVFLPRARKYNHGARARDILGLRSGSLGAEAP